MVDIHSHILFDIDDGSSNISESIELLSNMSNIGFKKVILTPHYIEASNYNANNKKKISNYQELKKRIEKNNIDIEIYLGNEIFVNDNILELIDKKEICSLNNSKYLLIELPLNSMIISLNSIINDLKDNGYIPIIAHPERYSYFINNYSFVDDMKRNGVLFQCNYSSILGRYGIESKRLIKYMLKKKYVDYLGTDIHNSRDILFTSFSKAEKRIIRIVGKNYYNKIMNNCNELVENKVRV